MGRPNPFAEEKLDTREWHDRLGDGFWRGLHRSALSLEELDASLSDPENSPCKGYRSQATSIAAGLTLVAVLDHDDLLFLPPELSLASLHRGVSVEHYVGQWRGNLLDPGKGRLPPGSIVSNAFQLVPAVGSPHERLEHGYGAALAMRLRNHSKLVVLPMLAKEFRSSETLELLRLVQKNPAPLVFVVMDGDAEAAADACGLRALDCSGESVFEELKKLKNGVDRARSRREPLVAYFSRGAERTESFSSTILGVLEKKKWYPEEGLHKQIKSEVAYGIERARMIPLPPRNTVVQDVRARLEPALEAQWLEWKAVHGK